jgi:hypothetical protein
MVYVPRSSSENFMGFGVLILLDKSLVTLFSDILSVQEVRLPHSKWKGGVILSQRNYSRPLINALY